MSGDGGGGGGDGGDGGGGGGGGGCGDKMTVPTAAAAAAEEKEVSVGDVQALLAARLCAPTRIVAVLGNRDAAIHNARLEAAVALCTQERAAFLLHTEYDVEGALGRGKIAAAVRAAGAIAPKTDSWAGDFLLGKNSYDTIEEAVMLRLVLERQFPPPRRLHVTVVTSAYHAARTERIFLEAFASSAGIHFAVVGAPNGIAATCGALDAECKKVAGCIHAEERHMEKFQQRCAPLGFGAFYLARGLLQTFGVPCSDVVSAKGFLPCN